MMAWTILSALLILARDGGFLVIFPPSLRLYTPWSAPGIPSRSAELLPRSFSGWATGIDLSRRTISNVAQVDLQPVQHAGLQRIPRKRPRGMLTDAATE